MFDYINKSKFLSFTLGSLLLLATTSCGIDESGIEAAIEDSNSETAISSGISKVEENSEIKELKYVQEALLVQIESEEELIDRFEEALILRSGALARIYLDEALKEEITILPLGGIGMSNRQIAELTVLTKQKISEFETSFDIKYTLKSGASDIIKITVSKENFSGYKAYIITDIDGEIPSFTSELI
ncbi:hypothetical protein [Chengkuizengella sediminis]|uniref:hypothetical protein n=1 Tax=Chengkuizengella sediminis TaxID=1885917 RepID=UPI001389D0FB|nr:hypothetical protein [Chengkuizengella sediminis]NDI35586.1 hypothetical protein [Chengkuizengella sediminis]